CDWGKKNTDISKKYDVHSYPTVLFTDAKGKLIEPLGDRSPEGVLSQIEKNAKSTASAAFDSWDKAVETANKHNNPTLHFLAAKNRDSEMTEEALFDEPLDTARDAFVFVKATPSRALADAKRFNVANTDPPILLVLDPKAEKPEAAPLKKITGRKSAKEL